MSTSRFERFLPLAGILAGLLFAAFGLLAQPPSVEGNGKAQLAWYVDHKPIALVAAFAGLLFLVVMAFFATAIRQALRSGEPSESTYSSVAYAGATLVGLAVALDSRVQMAIVEAAGKGQTQAVNTLSFLGDVGWTTWVAASAVMLLGTGLGGLRTAAFPRWLAIASVVLGVMCLLGPVGVIVFFLTPIWLITTGIVLSRRLAASAVSGSAAGTPAFAPAAR